MLAVLVFPPQHLHHDANSILKYNKHLFFFSLHSCHVLVKGKLISLLLPSPKERVLHLGLLARSEGLPLLLPAFVCLSVVHPPSAQVLQSNLIKLGHMDHWGT